MIWALSLAGALVLAACGSGGGGSGDGNVRVINLTRTHASLDLLVSANKTISAVAASQASDYAAVASGNNSLQITDAGTLTALATTAPSVGKDQYYSLLAYESNTVLKTAWLAENDTAPSAGTSNVRVFNLSPDSGALDVYITAPGVDLATVQSPTFTLSGTSVSQLTAYLGFTPGTYRVRATSSGNISDVRLDIPSITLADQGLATVLLAPTVGGGLIDGGLLLHRAAFAAYPTTKARVRVISGVSAALVTASVGSTVVEAGAFQPAGTYVTVPAGSASWAVNVGGVAAAVPPITLAAGSDNTLLITGRVGSATAAMLVDDNHAPTLVTSTKLRLINGLAGTTVGLSMAVDFTPAATNVVPGTASAYKAVNGNTNMRLEVTSPLSATPVSLQTGLNIPGGGVYTVFVLGESSAPVTSIRRDR